jgi:hypothetical protein
MPDPSALATCAGDFTPEVTYFVALPTMALRPANQPNSSTDGGRHAGGSSVAQGGTCRRRGDATVIKKFGHVPPDLGTDSGPRRLCEA